ncbi:MAG: biotin--[acetyl-CoA-carboxylase] ligase [Deltaproteobacteria bacterium]|nr:biotin--[acetyl-CoA-carboxylase] ligase [Deltaproteobacteria bacterium]MBW2068995.1 biotin--[acetyl-CoA-carboxylase] ligase [Deltaproteobacteria bacterium]
MSAERVKRLALILRELRTRRGDFVSGSKLANMLGVSRVMISKEMCSLEELGYVLEKRKGTGYRLIGVPDTIEPVEILSIAESDWLKKHYIYFPEITSTNDYALKLALSGAPEGTVVAADAQTSGRGRLGRHWMSLKSKGLYVSYLLRPYIPPRNTPQITLVAAITLIFLLRDSYGIRAKLKWPNDVVVEGKKIAGILAETHVEPQVVRFVVLGMGVNVHHDSKDFEGNFRYQPTSLVMESSCDKPIKRQDVLVEFTEAFERNYRSFLERGLFPWREALREVSILLGKHVTVDTGVEKISGLAEDLADDGSLVVRAGTGKVYTIQAGDVVMVR